MFVTNRCNATCEHCFYWRELNTKVKEELTVVEYDRLARSIGPMLQVTFTGGSPELRKDLPDLVERFYEHCHLSNMTFCMLGHSTVRILAHAEEMLRRCRGRNSKLLSRSMAWARIMTVFAVFPDCSKASWQLCTGWPI
jgi:molybdenum cofactor biosynthesis enzyme MoaA